MEWTLEQLAEICQGKLTWPGNEGVRADVLIRAALPLAHAAPGVITLVDHVKHVPKLMASTASAVVVPQVSSQVTIPQIVASDPHKAFSDIILRMRAPHVSSSSGISPRAFVDLTARIDATAIVEAGATIGSGCQIGKRCVIHANATIMADCRLGDDCEVFPSVTLYPNTVLAERVVIHAGAVLGAYGFGYRMVQGRHERTAQLGWVQVDSDVEIGAGTTIDRGTYGPTVIGEGTKIDNQVMIGHNCQIGKHNLICSQVGIAGSASTGDYVVLAGQVGLRDHTNHADRTQVGAQSGVSSDSKEGQILLGSPAIPHRDQIQIYMALQRLPEMRKKLRALEAKLEQSVSIPDDNRSDAA